MFSLPFSKEGFIRYLSNTNWMFFGQACSLVISFFVGAWVGRYLGPEQYGVLSYITSFVGVFSFIAGLGIENIIIKQLVEHKENTHKILGTSFVLKLLGGIVSILLIMFSAYVLEVDRLYMWFMLVFSIHLVIQSAQVSAYYFQANVEAKENSRALIYATIFTSLLKVVFILLKLPLATLFAILMLDSLWQAIGLLYLYKRKVGKFWSWSFDWPLGLDLMSKAWYLMIASAASFMLLKVDQLIVKYYMGEGELGIYAAAVKFVEIWYFIPTIICASLFPAILNARQTNQAAFKKRVYSLYGLLTMLALLISTFMFYAAGTAISSLFGLAYIDAVPILKLYVWSNLGLFLNIAINQYYIAIGKYKEVLLMNITAVVLNVTMNFLFIPIFGIFGAVFATLFSYTLVPIAVLFYGFFVVSMPSAKSSPR